MNKKTVRDIDVAGKTVLMRVDVNVPFRPGTVEVSDDSRITASLPTLRYLIERKSRVVLCAHLGRPKGKVVDEFRMAPVSKRLCLLLDLPVSQAPDCIGLQVSGAVEELGPGGILMLENLRFHPEEEANDESFARQLASLADFYVNDAFGAAHRAHASIGAVARFLPAVAGLLMESELTHLGGLLGALERPFIAVLGGAKVSDKLAALKKLAPKVDTLMIGGGMAVPFLKAKGYAVGASPLEDDELDAAAEVARQAAGRDQTLLLPKDVVVAAEFSESADHKVVPVDGIPASWRVMDIGPETAAEYEDALRSARTVVWNGTMGVAEWAAFAEGTTRIATALAGMSEATTVIGGGSTAETVSVLGLADKMTHVSTGGGASLELLEGKTLPGVAVLMDKQTESHG